ncbi:MAG: phosphatidylserine decarboxylase [Phycisphaerae bacterium]|nr:phosphatidylserine decarboxylase [Phycisphaerae bacterium]
MSLTRYGFKEWFIISLVAALLAAGVVWLQWWWVLAPIALAWLAFVAFFRDPWGRHPATSSPNDMVSPADGKVSAVLQVDNHPATDGPATIVRIFLSVLDVHLNRFPCDGVVVEVIYTPGKYLDARTEESAKVNESLLTVLQIASGERIGVRQVSGAIARRIVCPLQPGNRARRGARFGMIKFGSTTELILPRPKDVRTHVRVGDRVTGGVTILATLAAPAATASAAPAAPSAATER